MKLTFNKQLSRYEFRIKSRQERDGSGRLGLAIASSAHINTIAWESPHNGGPQLPVFHTNDPYKAMQLAEYADEETKALIHEQVSSRGGPVPILTYHNGCYVWSGPQEGNGILYRAIPKKAGFVFARSPASTLPRDAGYKFSEPVWWTEQATKAAQCGEYADEAAKLQIANTLARRHAALEASRADDADIDIPIPEGLVPYGYQRAGVAYAQKRRGVLFGDEMGLGKTIQAIMWINLLPEVKRVLVICPASLKRNWMRELAGDPLIGKIGWLVRPATVGIADSKYTQVVPDSDIVIINYELLGKRIDTGRVKMKDGKIVKVYEHHLRESLKGKWDLLIIDEAHKLKGDPKTVIRSRLAFSIQAERSALLTGTPMVNRPRELWNLVHYLAPKAFPNKRQFMDRYCAGGNNFMNPDSGASNLSELQEKLRLTCMVRRLKRDVLKDLPAKMRQVIELPADGCDALVKGEMLAFERKEDILTTMRLRVELAKASENSEDYKQAVSILRKGIQVAFEDLSRIRRETAVAKIPVVTEHVASILSEGHKVILFCHHKEVVTKIAEAFPRETVTLTGDTKMTDRDVAVTDFQTKDDIRLFIGTIGAAGVGLTLTASSIVVFAELDWVPGNVTQAEDRAHRIGQKDSVLIQHLVLEGSLDKRMADVLVEKQDIADRALDQESQDQLLADPVMPERERMATTGVSAKDIARAAEKMSQDDISAVTMGLRLLAGTHKDAGILDGATFRSVDAPLGKTLAEQKKLTPRMAALGKKLLSRYKANLAMIPEIQRLFSREETT